MVNQNNSDIIRKAQEFFRKEIAPNHIDNTKKLTKLKEYNLNPFLDKYKASFDLIVGVFYGTPQELSGHYKKINEEYPVYVGTEFWYRLTGEEDFYKRLTNAIGDVASEYDSSKLVNEVIVKLAEEIALIMDSKETT